MLGKIGEMINGLLGLGAVAQPRYGTKAWWQWYAIEYLPRYYNQQQIIQKLLQNPLYSTFGLPYPYSQVNPYAPQTYGSGYYPYGGYQPGYQNNYPYYGYGNSYTPEYPYAYASWQGAQGADACQAQGGQYDYFQRACYSITGQPPYGNVVTGTYQDAPPNVIGRPKWEAVATLNGAGFGIWLLNEDGIPQGVPPGYDPRRVDIAVANGIVTSASVG